MKTSITTNAQIIKHWGKILEDYQLVKKGKHRYFKTCNKGRGRSFDILTGQSRFVMILNQFSMAQEGQEEVNQVPDTLENSRFVSLLHFARKYPQYYPLSNFLQQLRNAIDQDELENILALGRRSVLIRRKLDARGQPIIPKQAVEQDQISAGLLRMLKPGVEEQMWLNTSDPAISEYIKSFFINPPALLDIRSCATSILGLRVLQFIYPHISSTPTGERAIPFCEFSLAYIPDSLMPQVAPGSQTLLKYSVSSNAPSPFAAEWFPQAAKV